MGMMPPGARGEGWDIVSLSGRIATPRDRETPVVAPSRRARYRQRDCEAESPLKGPAI